MRLYMYIYLPLFHIISEMPSNSPAIRLCTVCCKPVRMGMDTNPHSSAFSRFSRATKPAEDAIETELEIDTNNRTADVGENEQATDTKKRIARGTIAYGRIKEAKQEMGSAKDNYALSCEIMRNAYFATRDWTEHPALQDALSRTSAKSGLMNKSHAVTYTLFWANAQKPPWVDLTVPSNILKGFTINPDCSTKFIKKMLELEKVSPEGSTED
jgi:hypothetical protein